MFYYAAAMTTATGQTMMFSIRKTLRRKSSSYLEEVVLVHHAAVRERLQQLVGEGGLPTVGHPGGQGHVNTPAERNTDGSCDHALPSDADDELHLRLLVTPGGSEAGSRAKRPPSPRLEPVLVLRQGCPPLTTSLIDYLPAGHL